ncbi:hypothetical protein N7470_005972 [Penicillium chermesinum]|nr:hypothetical protein N7470_005972 [Penicillium chermesinum]
MANTGYTSPFPTSHDTIGQSTLVTPLFMPSSPPHHPASPSPPESPLPESPLPADSPVSERFQPHGQDDRQQVNKMQRNGFSGPRSPTGADLDARLAEYTLDFSQFPSGHLDDVPLPEFNDEEDKLSDVGGPQDFTANMEKYLMGEDEPDAREDEGKSAQNTGQRRSSIRSRQPAVEEDASAGDYSEFGPPVDIGFVKDSTQLEDIQEDPADNSQLSASPSLRKVSNGSEMTPEDREEWLHRRIVHLEEEVRDRDDQIRHNRERVLEAESANNQIQHLKTELQHKIEYIQDLQAKDAGDEELHDKIEALKKENQDQERALQQSNANQSDMNALKKQLLDMRERLQDRDSQASVDAERLETIAHLQQQLSLARDQLHKRDEALEETMAKLKEVTRAKEVQLQEKNSDIDRLKAEIDDQALQTEKLETEIDRVKTAYQELEDRLTGLETKNQPLEARNQTLEADLTRAQSQVEAQENALKAVVADLPRGNRSTYSEILDLIKDLEPPGTPSEPGSPVETRTFAQQDIHSLGDEVLKLRQELQEATANRKAADAEATRFRDQAAESQTLMQNTSAENSRLTKRIDELTASLAKTQREGSPRPASKPASVTPKAHSPAKEEQQRATAEMEEVHQAQIKSLQTAHLTAISTLRSSHAESMRKFRDKLIAAEQREADTRAELKNVRTSSSTQESQLRKSIKSMNAEIQRLESIIAAKEEAAIELDRRIALSVQKKEREWQHRVDVLLKERETMSKALMMYWGEKELGSGPDAVTGDKENRRPDGEKKDGEKAIRKSQAYRYKYVQRNRSKSKERSQDQ